MFSHFKMRKEYTYFAYICGRREIPDYKNSTTKLICKMHPAFLEIDFPESSEQCAI